MSTGLAATCSICHGRIDVQSVSTEAGDVLLGMCPMCDRPRCGKCHQPIGKLGTRVPPFCPACHADYPYEAST